MRKRKTNCLLLLLYLLVLLPAYVYAQNSILETKVTLQLENKTLSEVLEQITSTYQVPFSYFQSQLPLHKKVSIHLQDRPLQQVLEQVSRQAGIRYQAIGGQIVLNTIVNRQKADAPKSKQAPVISTPPRSFAKQPYIFLADNSGTAAPKEASSAKKYGPGLSSKYYPPLPSTDPAATRTAHRYRSVLNRYGGINKMVTHQQPFIESGKLSSGLITVGILPTVPVTKPVYTRSTFQLALVPGVSTHGIHPGEYTNAVSVNLLAGYSAGNRFVEIGGLSNFNQNDVFGLQMGGLANVVGGNKFAGLSDQEKQKLKKENTEANLQGFQVAGLTNIVAGNVFGWQTTGGINIVQKSLQGVQLAGISNLAKTYTFGLQLAGISNASMESVDGLQIAGLYNYTDGELHGIQLSAFNQAGEIEGKRSLISVNHTGLQIGLVNTARRMNGFQIGLVNIGGDMAGTQVGLINLNAGKHGKGVPIGLFNLNTRNEFVRLYTSELFMSNLEVSTGSLRIQNMVSIGYNALTGTDVYRPKWSIGYSIGQIKWPNKQFFYSYDAGMAHINRQGKLTRQLSLLTRARATAGYKIQLRKVVFHLFGGLTFNSYVSDFESAPLSPGFLRLYQRTYYRTQIEMWPGFVAGIHL